MPSKGSSYKYKAPPRPSIKAPGGIRKALKESGLYNLKDVQSIYDNLYAIRYAECQNSEIYVNNPQGHWSCRESSLEKMYEKAVANFEVILNEFPEYVEEKKRLRAKEIYKEWSLDLDSQLFPYNNAQYQYDSNTYQMNQKRVQFQACVEAIFKANPDRSEKWYEKLYEKLRNEEFKLTNDAKEHISITFHTSCWSYLEVEIDGEIIKVEKVSYRSNEVNRV